MGWVRIDRLSGPPSSLWRGDELLIGHCYVARTPWARLAGLLGTSDLLPHEALLIPRCRSVHTYGLRIPVGCAWLDPDGTVRRIVDPLPCRRVAGDRGAAGVLEFGAGRLRSLSAGDRLRWA